MAIYYKDDVDNDKNNNFPFMPESDRFPPIASLPPEVDKFISQDLNYLDKEFKFIKTTPNLNADETKALKELHCD